MAEVGQVIEIKGKNVVVELQRQEACAKCKACTAGLQTTQMLLEAENQCEATKGDWVEVYLKEANFVKAVLIMYTIPLVALLLGLGLGYLLFSHELLVIGLGFVTMALAFITIRLNDKRFRTEKYRPIAIHKVDNA